MGREASATEVGERPVIAAGGLLWRYGEDGVRLAVVHRTRYGGDWTVPKGKAQPGEEPQATALREVREETGYEARIVAWAGSLSYAARGAPKLVLFWHMAPVRGTFKPTDEVDKLEWLKPAEARTVLDYPREQALVADAIPPVPEFAPPSYFTLVKSDSSRAASHRLTSTVEILEAELDYRLAQVPELRGGPWERAIREGLSTVREHHARGEIDTAWRRLTAVARRELDHAERHELRARADALYHEAAAHKLASSWRATTVLELVDKRAVSAKDIDDDDLRWRVIEATRIRDEDSDNRYYRVSLIRGQRSLLLAFLILTLILLLGLTALIDWSGNVSDPSPGFVALVMIFGALGACLSAIQSLGHAAPGARIPEHLASSALTLTRPGLGAAAALGVYAIAASGILNITIEGSEAHLTVLALAFAAGFSERLVLSAVGAAAGATGQK